MSLITWQSTLKWGQKPLYQTSHHPECLTLLSEWKLVFLILCWGRQHWMNSTLLSKAGRHVGGFSFWLQLHFQYIQWRPHYHPAVNCPAKISLDVKEFLSGQLRCVHTDHTWETVPVSHEVGQEEQGGLHICVYLQHVKSKSDRLLRHTNSCHSYSTLW